ncbi:MAG: hypothetical protein EAZ91_14450 [Cytophagales bacterium]|nr:MAG: hypothetical protein EAZ91_14450 [Cytophagales bacterium]
MRKILKVVAVAILMFLVVELIGRYYGLTNFPLTIASKDFEYISKPNQDVRIYRNRFVTNEFSMRSEAISPTDTTVVLLLGDSVVNGGNSIDQDCLASSILEKKLSVQLKRKVRVLNISAKTWSPDNNVAYLKRFGTFGADMVVLVANSGDAFDPMTFQSVVGISPDHIDKNSDFAWAKIIQKGLPNVTPSFRREDTIDKAPIAEGKPELIAGFARLRQLANQLHVPFVVFMHQQMTELAAGKLEAGGVAIVDFCKSQQIQVVQSNFRESSYQDVIHLNCEGQQELASTLQPVIATQLD